MINKTGDSEILSRTTVSRLVYSKGRPKYVRNHIANRNTLNKD